MSCLVLDAPRSRGGGGPGPQQPCIIWPGCPDRKPTVYPTLSALARAVHRFRGRQCFRLARTVATYMGSDTFAAFKVFWREAETDSETYAFAIAGVGDRRELVELALETANPDVPV